MLLSAYLNMKKMLPFVVLILALLASSSQNAAAQNRTSLEEMQKQMREMQRQMMQGFQDLRSAIPDVSSDSGGVYFRFDTTFTGDGAHFFHFSLPNGGAEGGSGLEDFFKGFFDATPFNDNSPHAQAFPKDDGQLPHPDDELLPEERLRQQETQPGTDQSAPAPPPTTPKPAKKKPVVESIRI